VNEQNINTKYILAGTVAVLFTWLIHEFAHWLTSEILGYEAIMRLNVTSPISGENITELQRAIISISGPIVTVLQALIVFIFFENSKLE